MKIRSVTQIVRGLLKKAAGEDRVEEMKDRIREHLTRARDSGNDREILQQFLYENEGQPRAIRAMNLRAQLDGEKARVSDATLTDQMIERRTPLSERKIMALSESFPYHANSASTIDEEVEASIIRGNKSENSDNFYSKKGSRYEGDGTLKADNMSLEDLAGAFAFFSSQSDTTLEDDAQKLVNDKEKESINKLAHAFPHLCVSM